MAGVLAIAAAVHEYFEDGRVETHTFATRLGAASSACRISSQEAACFDCCTECSGAARARRNRIHRKTKRIPAQEATARCISCEPAPSSQR